MLFFPIIYYKHQLLMHPCYQTGHCAVAKEKSFAENWGYVRYCLYATPTLMAEEGRGFVFDCVLQCQVLLE